METSKKNLPDVQNEESSIKMRIPQVGVENINLPILIESREGGFREVMASVAIRTSLSPDVRGSSMSRLHLTLSKYQFRTLKQAVIIDILGDLNRAIGADSSFITFYFRLPVFRESPLSGYSFPVYHDCFFEGSIERGEFKFFQGVTVQYISYCPCSHRLSSESERGGIAHSQRSYANVVIQNEGGIHSIWLEDIIDAIEWAVINLPYPIVKREDEQEIARLGSLHPMFVEDAIRRISNELNGIEHIYDWIVKCTHKESIHESEAIAINWKGTPGGFDGTYFIRR